MALRKDHLPERAQSLDSDVDEAVHFDRHEIEGIDFISAEEGRALFDREARKLMGVSGDEFLQRWDSGEYGAVPDTPEGRDLGRLVMMIPFARHTPA